MPAVAAAPASAAAIFHDDLDRNLLERELIVDRMQ